ncbi:hypothetical protein TKK_0011643 [Trichogramma kaykai]
MDKKEEKRQYMKLKRAKESEKKSLRLEQKKIINLRRSRSSNIQKNYHQPSSELPSSLSVPTASSFELHQVYAQPTPVNSNVSQATPINEFPINNNSKKKLSSTEISRKRREKIKANPQLYAEQKEKERLRGIRRKESGAIKKVADMTSSEKKKFRKKREKIRQKKEETNVQKN